MIFLTFEKTETPFHFSPLRHHHEQISHDAHKKYIICTSSYLYQFVHIELKSTLYSFGVKCGKLLNRLKL